VPHTGKKAFYRPEKDQEEKPVFGYVPQKLEFDATSPMTVLDVFAAANSMLPLWLGIHERVREQAAATLKAVEADHLLHYKIGMLSGGQLQRVLLGLALTPVPDILLLDEPVSGVDPNGIELFYRMVSELREKYHMTILMASHDLSAAGSYADRIIFLNKSILHDGRPEEVLADPLVTQTFGHTPIIRKPLAPSPQPETCCRFHHDREGVI
jgi:zinc transport system ATP-binding protein